MKPETPIPVFDRHGRRIGEVSDFVLDHTGRVVVIVRPDALAAGSTVALEPHPATIPGGR